MGIGFLIAAGLFLLHPRRRYHYRGRYNKPIPRRKKQSRRVLAQPRQAQQRYWKTPRP